MNRNVHLLRRYIREAIDLGNVQFAPERIDGVDKSEPNTPEEERLYNRLLSRAEDSAIIDAGVTKTLQDLINSEKYGPSGSGFFGGPVNTSQLLYRGHAYTQAWVEKYVPSASEVPMWDSSNMAQINDLFDKMEPIKLNTPYTFGPNPGEGARGWTPDLHIATGFARGYARKLAGDITYKKKWADNIYQVQYKKKPGVEDWTAAGEPEVTVDDRTAYAVVLVLDPRRQPEDALLDFSRSIYKLKRTYSLSYEKEVMNLAPVQCHAAYVAAVV